MCADAEKIARFVKANLWDGQKQRLLRSYLSGPSDVEGFADDYAYLISGLLDLHSVTGETQWLAFAQQLQQKQDELFWDETAGKLFVAQVPRMLPVFITVLGLLKLQLHNPEDPVSHLGSAAATEAGRMSWHISAGDHVLQNVSWVARRSGKACPAQMCLEP